MIRVREAVVAIKKLWLKFQGKHICEENGCLQIGSECFLYDYDQDKELSQFYCPTHATKHGFCWCCGQFWAGCEQFDFEPSGLCPNCKDEVRADLGEYDEEDYPYADPYEGVEEMEQPKGGLNNTAPTGRQRVFGCSANMN